MGAISAFEQMLIRSGVTRLNVITDMLARLEHADKEHSLPRSDPAVVSGYAEAHIDSGAIAP